MPSNKEIILLPSLINHVSLWWHTKAANDFFIEPLNRIVSWSKIVIMDLINILFLLKSPRFNRIINGQSLLTRTLAQFDFPLAMATVKEIRWIYHRFIQEIGQISNFILFFPVEWNYGQLLRWHVRPTNWTKVDNNGLRYLHFTHWRWWLR